METAWCEAYLRKLGEMLEQQGIIGEILLAEGAVVWLDIYHQVVSKDVSVSFGPGEALLKAASLIAEQEGLPGHWLTQVLENRFLGRRLSGGVTYPGLHIYVAPLGYMLTMSLLFGSLVDDKVIHTLAKQLGLSTASEILSLVKAYLPEQSFPSQIQENIERKFAA